MGKSKISWTDYTFNPWIGCTKVSAGCTNCYAERDNKHRQWNKAGWGKGVPRHRTSEANWKKPYKWDKLAKENGVRYKVFCASLADVFDTEVPIFWLMDLLRVIRECENLDWLLLTKRIEQVIPRIDLANGMYTYSDFFKNNPHVWVGTTAENQAQADKRIPELVKIPASVKFLSCEPLLEKIDLGLIGTVPRHYPYSLIHEHINWVIVGGESGFGYRLMYEGWALDILRQCKETETPFFMKQMSGNTKVMREAIPEDLQIQEFPE